MTGPKILVLDIETSPALKWGYGMFNQNYGLEQIERKPGIIGWASRWEHEPARTCTWYDGPAMDGFTGSLKTLHDQLDEATHVMHFNGVTFDVPWTNHEFIKYDIYGGRPPSPFKQIDLMKQIKRNTRNISNKLDFLSRDLFDLEGKIPVNAMRQWLKMYHAYQAGDMVAYERAKAEMARYCKQDVNLLPKMKKKYLPWMTGINANLYNGDPSSCPNCGGSKLMRRGYAYSTIGKRQRWQCSDCGSWLQSARGAEFTDVRTYR